MSESGFSQSPRATYRVQLHAGFQFSHAAAIADYLGKLGISHFYASPCLQAAPGSLHGYDVLDHHRANDELGGDEAFFVFSHALARNGLGLLLDIVPNHMSISHRGNRWWWDVLENGQASQYAGFFDVDWKSPEAKNQNTVLMAILGDHYGRVLEAEDIRLERDGGSFILRYFDHVLPVAPRSMDGMLHDAAERAESDDLAFIADCLNQLPLATDTDRSSVQRRHRNKQVLRAQLERLCAENAEIAAAIEEVICDTNASPDELDVLLERQNYRLAYWRTARDELDYRRFFDVNFLVGLRAEDERVFQDTHAHVLGWVQKGLVNGLRVDHPDGLRDPEGYFERLRAAAPEAWILAEKIILPGERLPQSWPVQGTTGYDFIFRAAGVLVDPAGETPLTEFYADFTGESTDFKVIVHEKKMLVMKSMFSADLNRLTELFASACERHRRYRDYTRRELLLVLRETIACLPVYRTYARNQNQISDFDIGILEAAIEAAKASRSDVDADLFDFLRDILQLKIRGTTEAELVMQFQQQTGPVMAKGVEDTTFYNFNRLVALNEVGGDPGHWSMPAEQFHAECQYAKENHPYAQLATTTHDTKRSEDVRARLYVLSEIPSAWAAAVREWSSLNESFRTDLMPDRNTEYMLYQNLVGAWPIELPRFQAYMQKATREAKANTAWTDPNPKFEEALEQFCAGIFEHAPFLASLEKFIASIQQAGRTNSLAQLLLKITTPGVPDFYQGNELWDFSLVDPDNRRPVDYDRRRKLFAELSKLSVEQVMARADEGLPKMWVIWRAMQARQQRPAALSGTADYRELPVQGSKKEHAIAFIRGDDAITMIPRWTARLQSQWEGTSVELPEGTWQNQFTLEEYQGGELSLEKLLARFPVALLLRLTPEPDTQA
ncbi:MAG: malto-oligosyltrehalose synthase [Planctomycetota bacterium]|nr:malto-oligosyltrehalose synthase [Planctomycetota bacterium]